MAAPNVSHPVDSAADRQPIQNLVGSGGAVAEGVPAAGIATGAMAGAVDDHQAAVLRSVWGAAGPMTAHP